MVIWNELNDLICLTLQDKTQFFQCVQGDGLVVFQIVNGSRVKAVPVNQGIGGDALLGHGVPQRFITDHIHAPLLQSYPYYLCKKG